LQKTGTLSYLGCQLAASKDMDSPKDYKECLFMFARYCAQNGPSSLRTMLLRMHFANHSEEHYFSLQSDFFEKFSFKYRDLRTTLSPCSQIKPDFKMHILT
jgi:hypothetical protein